MTQTDQDRSYSLPFTPNFRRQGGAWQLSLESMSDLRHALDLDDALWVANSAPLSTFAADPVFLRCLDQDGDGRFRVDAIRAAIRWFLDHLEPEPLGQPGDDTLKLEAIRPAGPDSAKLIVAARKVVRRYTADATAVSLEQVRQIIRQVEEGGLDHPGLVRPKAATATQVRELIEDILVTLSQGGSNPPPAGITLGQLERFLAEGRVYLDWLDEPRTAGEPAMADLMPLGEASMNAFDLFTIVAPRIDHYFALCDAVRFNLACVKTLGTAREGSQSPDWNDPEAVRAFVMNAPVAWPTPEGRLDFSAALNPHLREPMEAFRRAVLEPLLGAKLSHLDAEQWQRVKQIFVPHAEWRARQPASFLGSIPVERLRRYLDRKELADQVRTLLADSHHTSFDLQNLRRLEKLILFQIHLVRLANSFVNFSDLYHPDRSALFEMGTLIMDGRRFTFSVKVADRALHARFSNASNMFVLYAEITGDNAAKLYEVAVPVTAGTKGTLQVDKWGTFLDRQGRTFNARIVQVVENPISLREAIAAPFKRLGRALMARFGEKSLEEEKRLELLTTQALASSSPAANQADRRPGLPLLANPGGVLAGGGIAIAALGSSLAFITRTLSELEWTTIIAALLGAVAAVVVPVGLVAVIKLAGRDLSGMLEGSGWGINARMALTRTLAGTFTRRPRPLFSTPKPRARKRLWILLVLLALALAAGGLMFWWS
jgi:hypothetical protein